MSLVFGISILFHKHDMSIKQTEGKEIGNEERGKWLEKV